MPDIIWTGRVKKGYPVYDDARGYFQYVASLGHDTEIETITRKKRKRKSNKQNKYYRGVVIPMIAESTGYTKYEYDDVHRSLVPIFFMGLNKKGKPCVLSTKLDSWTTSDWEEKMAEIRQWASEKLNIYIPLPNECDY